MIVFENENYIIRKIPLNFQIEIKKNLVHKGNKGLGRIWYHPLDWDDGFENPLEAAKWVAGVAVRCHFVPL